MRGSRGLLLETTFSPSGRTRTSTRVSPVDHPQSVQPLGDVRGLLDNLALFYSRFSGWRRRLVYRSVGDFLRHPPEVAAGIALCSSDSRPALVPFSTVLVATGSPCSARASVWGARLGARTRERGVVSGRQGRDGRFSRTAPPRRPRVMARIWKLKGAKPPFLGSCCCLADALAARVARAAQGPGVKMGVWKQLQHPRLAERCSTQPRLRALVNPLLASALKATSFC